jgi:hypothetical protein
MEPKLNDLFKSYNDGKITDSELRIRLVENVTEKNVEEVLSSMPPEMLQIVKEHSVSDKPIRVLCMGSWIGRTVQQEQEEDLYTKGLSIIRKHHGR